MEVKERHRPQLDSREGCDGAPTPGWSGHAGFDAILAPPLPDAVRHPFWPLFELRVLAPGLELRLPTDEEAIALARVAAAGIHDPAVMPFSVPWTDLPPGDFERGFVPGRRRSSSARSSPRASDDHRDRRDGSEGDVLRELPCRPRRGDGQDRDATAHVSRPAPGRGSPETSATLPPRVSPA